MTRFCQACGGENQIKSKFCNHCGKKLLPVDMESSTRSAHGSSPAGASKKAAAERKKSSGKSSKIQASASSSPSPSVLPPRKPAKKLLDNRYEILHIIKTGAMGCVYKAQDTRLGSIVAVKKLLTSFISGNERKYAESRFKEEARLLSRLHHGGLPKVIDFFVEKDETGQMGHFLVMTFVEGKDLDAFLAGHNYEPLPPDTATNFFQQILDILAYLHSQEPPVIYRDIKPSNVMLQGKRIFLVDFGIARVFDAHRKGTMIGTPGFCAPEQYQGMAEPRSDLYSLGVLMHHLLTGMIPQSANRPLFTFDSIRKYNNNVPEYLDRIILRMLELKPENRPESSETILTMLRDAQISVSVPQVVVPAPPHVIAVASPSPVQINAGGTPALGFAGCYAVKPRAVLPSSLYGYSTIFEAIRAKNFDAVKGMLRDGTFVDTRDKEDSANWSPLHWAAQLGLEEISSVLLDFQADIDIQDDHGDTPLHLAVANGHERIINLLVARGANLEITDDSNYTPLHAAAWLDQDDLVNLLVNHGSDINSQPEPHLYTPLHVAAVNGNAGAVSALLALKARVDPLDFNGVTPLMMAAMRGNVEVVTSLLDAGADINITAADGTTSFHMGVYSDNPDLVSLLIGRNADIEARNSKDQSPFDLVNDTENGEKIAELLKNQ